MSACRWRCRRCRRPGRSPGRPAQSRADAVAFAAIEGVERIEHLHRGLGTPQREPCERAGRIVHAERHRRVGAGGVANALLHRVAGFVDQHRDRAGDHQARHVGQSLRQPAERAQHLCRLRREFGRGLGRGRPGQRHHRGRRAGGGRPDRPVEQREIGQPQGLGPFSGATAVGQHQAAGADLQAGLGARVLRLAREAQAGRGQARGEQVGDRPRAMQCQRHGGQRRGRGLAVAGLGAALRVAIEAAAGLAPQQAAIDHLALHQRGLVALVVEVGLVDRLRHREVGVVADQVHQLARPHAKAGAAHAGVQHRRRRGLFLQQRQRLGVERTRDAIDDEARRGLRVHRGLAPVGREHVDGVRHGRLGGQAGDHLHQPHQGHRIEEVHAHDAARHLQAARDRRDRQRRGVGRQHALGRHDRLQVTHQRLLDAQVLDDGLDHERGVAQVVQGGGHLEPCARRRHVLGRQLALVGEPGQRGGQLFGRRRGRALAHVVQVHGMTGQQRHLDDADTHHAGADHGDGAIAEEVDVRHGRHSH